MNFSAGDDPAPIIVYGAYPSPSSSVTLSGLLNSPVIALNNPCSLEFAYVLRLGQVAIASLLCSLHFIVDDRRIIRWTGQKNAVSHCFESTYPFSVHLQGDKITWQVAINVEGNVVPFCCSTSGHPRSESQQFIYIIIISYTIHPFLCHSFIRRHHAQRRG